MTSVTVNFKLKFFSGYSATLVRYSILRCFVKRNFLDEIATDVVVLIMGFQIV